jgi:hypothetical protein
MRQILPIVAIILIALSTATAIEIKDEFKLNYNLLPGSTDPKDTSDESGAYWIPKGDLGVTFNQATKGLEQIIPCVYRDVDRSGAPIFLGSSDDGKIVLTMWGTEAAIKTINLVVPFSVDPYRFSLGSWSDVERPKEILISCLNGPFPADSRENREWIEGYVRNVLSQPVRNFKNGGVETVDGRVIFKPQKPLVRRVSEKVEITLESSFGSDFNLEIKPPRNQR